jgi:hypothetical protein
MFPARGRHIFPSDPSLAYAGIMLLFRFVLGGDIPISYFLLGLVRWLVVMYPLFLMCKGDA